MPPRAPPRGGARGSGGASAGGVEKRAAFSSVTTPTKAGDADQGGGGGGGNKYAKLQKLTPAKAKKSSALRCSLTRDRAESQVVSRVSGDTIWNAGDLTNKRFEVNSDLVYGVKPLETKMQELCGSDAESRQRVSNRSVPFIVHYKPKVNKHLAMHHTVYHKTMVAEAIALVRRAAEAINTEVEVAFDEANVEIEHECFAKLEVFERVEMEDMFDGLVTVIAGDRFCVKEEIERLFSTPVFDYQQKLWFVKPEEFTEAALEVLAGTGASVTVVAPDEDA